MAEGEVVGGVGLKRCRGYRQHADEHYGNIQTERHPVDIAEERGGIAMRGVIVRNHRLLLFLLL